jgi:hypothetical protein
VCEWRVCSGCEAEATLGRLDPPRPRLRSVGACRVGAGSTLPSAGATRQDPFLKRAGTRVFDGRCAVGPLSHRWLTASALVTCLYVPACRTVALLGRSPRNRPSLRFGRAGPRTLATLASPQPPSGSLPHCGRVAFGGGLRTRPLTRSGRVASHVRALWRPHPRARRIMGVRRAPPPL